MYPTFMKIFGFKFLYVLTVARTSIVMKNLHEQQQRKTRNKKRQHDENEGGGTGGILSQQEKNNGLGWICLDSTALIKNAFRGT